MPNFSVTINLTKANRTPQGALALLELVSVNKVIINGPTFNEPVRNDICQMFTFIKPEPAEVLKIKRRLRASTSYLNRYDAIRSWN